MTGNSLPKQFVAGSVAFILLIPVGIYFGNYIFSIVALLFFIFYFLLTGYDKLYYFIVVSTPLSIGLDEIFKNLSFNISLPSEILMILLLFVLIVQLLSKRLFSPKIFLHPISIAVLIYLFWIFITSLTSSMPLVSLKFLIARLWFVLPLFFFPILLFKRQKNIQLFFGLYIAAFSIVIIYSIKKHLAFGLFDKQASHFVMQPFYNDHTSYGAILAMYIPILAGLMFIKNLTTFRKTIILLLLVLFSLALLLSYTRAAWISIVAVFMLAILIWLKLKLRYIFLMSAVAISLLFVYRSEIIDKLNKNKQDSSAEISEHIKSISNIATDASNLERINRWNAALKMFRERPVFGWGPGTYMFQYAPFQMAKDKTIISTNFGTAGNAHSEYIGPLVEQGIPGLFSILLLVGTIIYTALKVYYSANNNQVKILSFIGLLSLSTYFIHGLLNNFLDTDKAAVPFWGIIAMLVSLDIYQLDENKNPQPGEAEER
ncbi:MAG: O-antigen ligase family protein [Bacteroidales bacterium]